jgi:hypothetical protein
MLRPRSNAGIAAVTVALVLTWHLVVAGIAFAFAQGASDAAAPLLFLLAVPVLPGGSICMVVGAHSGACLPASVAANLAFYLAAVFIIRSRRARRARRADEATGLGGTN